MDATEFHKDMRWLLSKHRCPMAIIAFLKEEDGEFRPDGRVFSIKQCRDHEDEIIRDAANKKAINLIAEIASGHFDLE